MKRNKLLAAALALLLMLSLLPGAWALEAAPFPTEWFSGLGGGFSLRDMIDGTRNEIDLAGSSFQLENVLFVEECVVNEDLELCVCETTKDAMVLDTGALPAGCEVEIRREKVRNPDAKTGLEVAEEIRLEKAGQKPEQKDDTIDPADRDRETYYLYLTGRPTETGYSLFILWDGKIRLCSVEVVPYRTTAAEQPDGTDVMTQEWVDDNSTPMDQSDIPDQSGESTQQSGQEWVDQTQTGEQGTDQGIYTEEWVDTYDQSVPVYEDQNGSSQQESEISTTDQYTGNTGSYTQDAQLVPGVTAPPATVPPATVPPVTAPPVTIPPVTAPPVTATPTLPTPTVYISGDTQCSPGERAVLEVQAVNAYNPRYQWYTSLGYFSAPLEGATNSRYWPDTSHAGTWTFFCRVTSSAYGQETYADSEPVTFTVAEKTIASVNVETAPNKTSYFDGDTVDTTGLRLRVRYTDGSYDLVTSGFVVSPTTLAYNNSGTARVTVNYKGYQTAYPVEVHSYTELIRGIGVLTMPRKTSYTVGEWLDTTGLSIRVYSYDGRYLDVSEGFECSPTRLNTIGNQAITVNFGGKTCTFTVAVQEARRVYGLTVQSMPANRSYTVGDTINTAGLVLQLQTSSGTETITSGYTIAPRVASTAGTQQITVNYEGLSTSFTINVADNIPRPTPTPTQQPYWMTPSPAPYGTVSPSPAPYGTVSPSPAPYGTVTPTPSGAPTTSPAPTRTPTPAPARRNTGVSTLVKVLFGVAVVALGGLIGYVLYLRWQGGDEDYMPDEEPRGDRSGSDRNRRR